MRTTINIQDHALELCRKVAAETGQSLGEVVSEAIRVAYSNRPPAVHKRRYDLPVWSGGGLQPGVDLDNSAALQDLMDGLA